MPVSGGGRQVRGRRRWWWGRPSGVFIAADVGGGAAGPRIAIEIGGYAREHLPAVNGGRCGEEVVVDAGVYEEAGRRGREGVEFVPQRLPVGEAINRRLIIG